MKPVKFHGKIGFLVTIFLLTLSLQGSSRTETANQDIIGKWKVNVVSNGQQTEAALIFSMDINGRLNGRWIDDLGISKLENIKYEQNKLSFAQINHFGQTESSSNFTGTIKNGRLSGTLSADTGRSSVVGWLDKPGTGRIYIDVEDPNGRAGWQEQYVVELRPVHNIPEQFGVDWYKPYSVDNITTEKPDLLNVLPIFRYDMQRYLALRLGDAGDNEFFGVMDFREPDRRQFPFDLYLDRDRDGDLAEDFIEDRNRVEEVQVPYEDGTTEDYALQFYATNNEPISVAYRGYTGRYGILRADKKQIQLLIIDNSVNAVFNDDDDLILIDWDLDGQLDGSHQAKDYRPLYSTLELPGGSYWIAEIDAPGRRLVLQREPHQ